jgi:hypothetical protein
MDLFAEQCLIHAHNLDSELLDKYDAFFDLKELPDNRYLMYFRRYRHRRHPKTIAWLEFSRTGNNLRVLELSKDSILSHVLNSMFYEAGYNSGFNV